MNKHSHNKPAPTNNPPRTPRLQTRPPSAMPSSQTLLHPLLLLQLTIFLAPLPCSSGEVFKCSTPSSLKQRLPAILEIENICTSNNIVICLEFARSNYLIRSIKPSFVQTIPTVLHDCWIFRANSCNGEILLQHSVEGTRKISVGCSSLDTAAYNLLLPKSVSLDCTLTTVPRLVDAFNAALSYLTPADVPNISPATFITLHKPVQLLHRNDFLSVVYGISVILARHGVGLTPALSIFRHARALIWFLERCQAHLVGASLTLPESYLAVYGAAVASLQAAALANGTWKTEVSGLSPAQWKQLEALQKSAANLDVSEPSLDSVHPPSALVQSSARVLVLPTVTPVPVGRALQVGAVRVSQHEGQKFCDKGGNGQWLFWRLSRSESPISKIDCCSQGCLLFGQISGGASFSTQAFAANCCLMCNWAIGCNNKISAHTKAVLEMAEIQTPASSITELSSPVRVMV